MAQESPVCEKIGPIRLAPGVPAREIFVFLLVAALTGCMVSFAAIIQPFILTDLAHVPIGEQGRVAGSLATLQQVVLMTCVGVTGSLGDRFGRRILLVCTLAGFALSMLGFSLVTSLAALVVVRLVFGVASSLHTASIPPKFVEYPQEASRGKFMAMVMVSLNLASMVLVGLVASRLPSWLKAAGLGEDAAGRTSLWIAAGLAVVTATIAWRRMRPDHAAQKAAGPRPSLFSGFGAILAHARANPGFGLLLATALVIRTDETVLVSFLSLWVTISARAEGLGMLDALKIVGTLTVIKTATSMAIPLLMGPVIDRVNRAKVYAFAVGFVGCAFVSTLLVSSVTGWGIYVVMVVISIGESLQILSQQALFGQEAPRELRGTAYGILAVLGTVSVIGVSLVGGLLFDRIGPNAPFVLSGAAHLVVLGGYGMWLLARRGRKPAAVAAPVAA